jgi:hypothetical protein
MLLSDVVLHVTQLAPLTNRYEVMQQGVNYLSFALVVWLGTQLHRFDRAVDQVPQASWRAGVSKVLATVGCAVGGSLLFFLLTNFAVWLTATESMPPPYQYPKTLVGLLECYGMAMPFLRNSMLGDLYYVMVLFGGYAVLRRALPTLRLAPRPSGSRPAVL